MSNFYLPSVTDEFWQAAAGCQSQRLAMDRFWPIYKYDFLPENTYFLSDENPIWSYWLLGLWRKDFWNFYKGEILKSNLFPLPYSIVNFINIYWLISPIKSTEKLIWNKNLIIVIILRSENLGSNVFKFMFVPLDSKRPTKKLRLFLR